MINTRLNIRGVNGVRMLIIRHGDPDYERDSLTPKGWREAEMLALRLEGTPFSGLYVSPLGRAKDTASLTLHRLGREAVELDWLREFHAPINRPDVPDKPMIPWDWLPQDWLADERFLDINRWYEPRCMASSTVKAEYDRVAKGLDSVLSAHGYERDGRLYRAVRPNHDVIAFFCHFGVGCVMLSHLLSISPMVLWHGACAAPTSVTTLNTEERREGIACWRMSAYGDVSHLYAHGEPSAFSARFCECYQDDTRHD